MQKQPLVLSRLALFSLALVPALVLAQVAPDAGSLLRDQQAVPATPQTLPRERQPLPAPLPDSGQRVLLKQVVFKGFEGLATEAELQALVAPALNQSLGFNGLQHLTELVTQHLKEKGWFLAFAYLPEQDVSQGVLSILIEPGQIDQLHYESTTGDLPLSTRQINRTLNLRNDQDAALRAQRLERGLLLLNDLPGVSARSNLEQGRDPGTTSVRVLLDATPRYTASVWADNHGNRFTGAGRLNALGSINNLSGRGDQLNLQATLASGQHYTRLGYTAPLGHSGLTGEAALSHLGYELGKALESSRLQGSALNASAALRYPLIRSRLNNLHVQGAYDYKALDDDAAGSRIRERTLHNLTLSLQGDAYDRWQGGGLSNYSLGLTFGSLDRGNAADLFNDQNSFKTDGGFSKINFSVLRLQKLTEDFSLLASLRGQLALNNLDSSEQFSLGGAYGVRAYPTGESSGDSGWLLTLEGRYDWQQYRPFGATIQFSAFHDAGGVTLSKDGYNGYVPPNKNETNSHTLMGVGIGAALVKARQWNLRTSLAFKLKDEADDRSLAGKDADNQSRDVRLWLQGIAWF